MHIRKSAPIWFTIFITHLCFFICAQNTSTINLRKYTPENGLSNVNVHQILQDKYGYMYIATQGGLDRFDGKNYIHFRKTADEKHKILGTDIRSMVEDTLNNILWVLPGENGFSCISTKTGTVIKNIPIPTTNENDWYNALAIYNKKLLIGSFSDIKIYDIKKNSFEKSVSFTSNKLISDYQINSFEIDKKGNLWVCYKNFGIVIYDKNLKKLNELSFYDFNFENIRKLNTIKIVDNDEALIGTDKGLFSLHFNDNYSFTIQKINPPIFSNNENIECIYKTKNENIYVSSASTLYRFEKNMNSFTNLNDADYDKQTNWLADVICITEDKDNNLWLGCNKGVAYYNTSNIAFKSFYKNNSGNERLEHLRGIFVSDDNTIYASLFNGVAKIKNGTDNFTIKSKSYSFNHVFELEDKSIFISRSDELLINKKGNEFPISEIYNEFKSIPKLRVNSHIYLNDSIVILGSENNLGVIIWNTKAKKVNIINDRESFIKIESNILNTIFQDSKKNIFILSDNIITVLDPSLKNARTIKLQNFENKQMGLFFDIIEHNDSYWIASYGNGLIEVDKNFKVKNIYTQQNGLSDEGIYKLFTFQSKLFITSNNGLSVFNFDTRTFKNYYKEDGLQSNSFEEAVGFMKDSLLYLGGIKGFTIVNPNLISTNKIIPQLFINRIEIDSYSSKIDTTNLNFNFISIPSDVLQTKISFSAISYTNPQLTTFAYRILEKSKDWISLNKDNFITPIGLSHGKYHLQVKAANEDGIESAPKELILIFLPKWYQTWWFKVLVALSLIGIGFALYKIRVAQIIKEQKIKNALASDLHDELGSSLTGLKVYAYQAKKNPEYMASLEEGITQSIKQVREMIWQLNEEKLTVHDLINKLAIIYKPLLKIGNTELHINIDSSVASLELLNKEKSHLYLILKEIINNALKYSQATELNITVQKGKNRLLFTIADNGIGIQDEGKGYGLKNIEQRAKEIKYSISRTSTNTGTIYSITK